MSVNAILQQLAELCSRAAAVTPGLAYLPDASLEGKSFPSGKFCSARPRNRLAAICVGTRLRKASAVPLEVSSIVEESFRLRHCEKACHPKFEYRQKQRRSLLKRGAGFVPTVPFSPIEFASFYPGFRRKVGDSFFGVTDHVAQLASLLMQRQPQVGYHLFQLFRFFRVRGLRGQFNNAIF
jgi:hypothetical protein